MRQIRHAILWLLTERDLLEHDAYTTLKQLLQWGIDYGCTQITICSTKEPPRSVFVSQWRNEVGMRATVTTQKGMRGSGSALSVDHPPQGWGEERGTIV